MVSQRNFQKLKSRLERLLIPYIIYPLFVWSINNLMFLITKYNRFNRLLTLNELKLNLIVGKGIFGIGVLWFHFNLLILTIPFFISSIFLGIYFLILFQIIGFINLIIQYSEINYKYFIQYNINISMPLGNLAETFTVAIFAFSLSEINIFQIFLKNRKKSLFFSILFLYLISNYKIFSPLYGFSSAGLKQNIISFLLFNIFYLIDLESINSTILGLIQQTTKFTQGIYCLHFLIQYYLKLKLDKNGTFIGCVFLIALKRRYNFRHGHLFLLIKLLF